MKKKEKGHLITEVAEGSIAQELELEAGDRLIAINNNEMEDIFDYQYMTEEEYLVLLIKKKNGEEWELEIEKEEDEDLGLTFENGLMSEYRSCCNKCMFCFIDQMPPGMRETLYFKDDDSRLSFLQGNYITLTNMRDKDIQRIIRYHLSPINISVHTTNPELRCKMLHNRFAGEALKKIDMLYEAGTQMNSQIVLCKGVNDGEELRRTIQDLMKYMPYMQSLSVVPVGLTKYREGLYPLEPFGKEDAAAAIDIIEEFQKVCFEQYGTHFVQASDEFYILAEREIPEEERYDGYIQLENGVGMIRLLLEESKETLEELEPDDTLRRRISIATGKLAAPFLSQIVGWIGKKFPNLQVDIYPIVNHFFGELITVSGLVTAQDLIAQLKGMDLGEELLLPANMLRSGEDVFLDDLTVSDVEKALQVKVNIVKSSGQSYVYGLLGMEQEESDWNHQPYELE
ncbi:MAG: DUF512 domain-containing protein [Lachnospiraceae bacterium]